MQPIIWRSLKKLPIPTIVAGGLFVGFTGDIPLAEIPMGDLLASLDVTLYENVGQPLILVFSLGLGVSWVIYWLVQLFLRSAEKRRILENFKNNHRNLGHFKNDFFRLLRIAYATYRENILNHGDPMFYGRLNEDFNLFIDEINYPDWLDGKNDDLSSVVSENLDQREPEWNFALAVYREIEGFKLDGDYRELFGHSTNQHFHMTRRHLDHFWYDAGKDISKKLLKISDIQTELHNDRRVIKFLPFLSVVLYHLNHQSGPGSNHLYNLGKRVSD